MNRKVLFPLLAVLLIISVLLPVYYLPMEPQPLSEYLKELFESHEIILHEDDFLAPTEDSYLAYAKMVNLVPADYYSEQRISQKIAGQIDINFLAIQDKLLLDGLYGKIDMHEHYRTGGDVEEFLTAAGCLGISKVVFLPTGMSPDNSGYRSHQYYLIEDIKKKYPDRVIAFCTTDESDPEAAELVEQCLKAGADGLKLIGGHPDFYDEPLNSANMYRVYEVVVKYGVPVLLHGSIINIPELKDQLDQVYSDFPEITFIHAHYCSTIMDGINLDICAELLDKHPNLYIDLSMGGGISRYHYYFSIDIEQVKNFVIDYQDRILFGSDIILNTAEYKDFDWLYSRIKCDIDLHEQEEYIPAFGDEGELQQGFALDEAVLRKLYYENPMKILGD
jgi:predicted TIM-barrel fold metal-dependent hydrolase